MPISGPAHTTRPMVLGGSGALAAGALGTALAPPGVAERGIGAVRDWIAAQMRRYARAWAGG